MCKTALTDGHQRAIRSGKISVSRRGRRGREGGRKWEGGKGTCMYTTKYYQSTPPSGSKVKSYIIIGKCYSMGERRRVLHRRVFYCTIIFIEPVMFVHCTVKYHCIELVTFVHCTVKYHCIELVTFAHCV